MSARRRLPKPKGVPAEPPAKNHAFRWITPIVAVSGWLAALFIGLLDLPAKINSFAKEQPQATERVANWLLLDKALTGSWTSSQPEGEVIAKHIDAALDALEGAPVHLQMTVYRGRVEGTISSGGLGKLYPFSLVELEGRSRAGHIEGTAWDVVNGEKVALGGFTLTPAERNGEPVLLFDIVRQSAKFFPSKAILWQALYPPEGELNPRFLEAVKSAAGKVAQRR